MIARNASVSVKAPTYISFLPSELMLAFDASNLLLSGDAIFLAATEIPWSSLGLNRMHHSVQRILQSTLSG